MNKSKTTVASLGFFTGAQKMDLKIKVESAVIDHVRDLYARWELQHVGRYQPSFYTTLGQWAEKEPTGAIIDTFSKDIDADVGRAVLAMMADHIDVEWVRDKMNKAAATYADHLCEVWRAAPVKG